MPPTHVDVLIVGAGLSGVGTAAQLTMRCPGKSFLVLERREAIGGTWDFFRYPGIRCDSDMHTLGYSFRPWPSDAIITEAALSFLGAGVPPPAPSWGNMLYDGKAAIFNGWWIAGFPALIVAITTIALTMVGDGLRDMFDPKGQRPRGNLWGLLLGRRGAKW